MSNLNTDSVPVIGKFSTTPKTGQGWGINPELGGMKIYETIRKLNPDFFIHCGDYIYADGPLKSEVELDDGTIWKNLTTPEKSKVAETLKEFRGNYI